MLLDMIQPKTVININVHNKWIDFINENKNKNFIKKWKIKKDLKKTLDKTSPTAMDLLEISSACSLSSVINFYPNSPKTAKICGEDIKEKNGNVIGKSIIVNPNDIIKIFVNVIVVKAFIYRINLIIYNKADIIYQESWTEDHEVSSLKLDPVDKYKYQLFYNVESIIMNTFYKEIICQYL